MRDQKISIETSLGAVTGLEHEGYTAFLGVPFARAGRFEYAELVEKFGAPGEVLDATKFGPGCPQNRGVNEHLEHPTRKFYKKEFREGDEFTYSEDCLNLNIFVPGKLPAESLFPVILFFFGGGFNSGLNAENTFDGAALARQGVMTVFANYRVGPLGYLTHEEIRKRTGRDGNFGLDDQLAALRWVRKHISEFGGDPENITLMGQSAGAISVQYLSLMPENKGLFRRAVMMSGAGKFPDFALPKRAEDTHEYWLDFMRAAGCKDFNELKTVGLNRIFDAVEELAGTRKDNLFCTMPVVDGVLLPRSVGEMIKTPLPISYMLGYSNTDMYAPIMAHIGNKFGKQNGAYIYFFDLDAPGDDNKAFHAADLRYVFDTLDRSWRPFGPRDHEAAAQLTAYVANFAKTGDPNKTGLPEWKPARKGTLADVLHIAPGGTKMGRAHYLPLTLNFLKHPEPKA